MGSEGQSKAGRNLPAAILSGVILGALVLVSLFTIKWLFGMVAAAAMIIGVLELRSAFASRGIRIERWTLIAAVLASTASAYIWGAVGLIAVLGLAIIVAMVLRLRLGVEGYVRDITANAFVAVYLPFMVGFVMVMLRSEDGPQRVLAFILLTVGNDIGGYFAGVLFGRHPIAPSISPKKSWEGLGGSLVLQAALGAVSFIWLLHGVWWQGVIAGLVLTITATAGDFAESAIKRDLGVKDMGTFLPGHGGMMDRLDSLIPNAFAAWLIFGILLGFPT